MHQLTPKQIVEELDKYIIGQEEAKKAVAIALRKDTVAKNCRKIYGRDLSQNIL